MEILKALILTTVVLFTTTKITHARIEKISVQHINRLTQAAGFQTFRGKVLRSGDLESSTRKVVPAIEVIKKDFIEMKDGEIYYPEEIEYVFQVKGTPTFKSPKEDERAPQDNDSH